MDRECIFCGTLLDDERKNKYICNVCDGKMIILRQLTKVDKAVERMRKARKRYFPREKEYTYQDERFSVVNKIIKKDYRFNSSDELCVALQCEKENIEYIPNFKIGNYYVDFFLPSLKIIFEVDGELYHMNAEKDFIRERGIMHIVGEKYEIVRLGDAYIPDLILLNFKESLKHVVYQRNANGKFRDTRNDMIYFKEYINLAGFLRRSR